MGEDDMSDVYLLTRAAYAKLSRPVAKAALRLGLTPDSVTILGTAGTVIAALTLFPIGQLWWGAFAVFVFVLAYAAAIPFMNTSLIEGPVARAWHGADVAYFVNLLVAALLYGVYRLLIRRSPASVG